MNNERSIDELIEAFNTQAQADGRFDSRTFWEVAARPGSIHDVPETDKSAADLAWFRERRLAKRAIVRSTSRGQVDDCRRDRSEGDS